MTSQGGNNYSFGEKVGSGSYSTVFKAYQKQVSIKVCLDGFLFSQNHKHLVILDFFFLQDRSIVAIKVIQKAQMSPSAIDNLITEIRLLKTLKHRHIVEMKDFYWDDK